MNAPMEEQRKATIRDRFSAASRAVMIGSAGSLLGTALLYRSYVRDRISPPKKSEPSIDWEVLGQKILYVTMPILAEAFAKTSAQQQWAHGHPEEFDCGNPDCSCQFTDEDTIH